jgi:hypothetical protein
MDIGSFVHDGVNAASGGSLDAYNTGYQDGLSGGADDAITKVGFGLAKDYENGYAAGKQAAAASAPSYDQGSIGVDPGGVSLDEYQAPAREALEALSHQHTPHTENPEYETEAPWEPPPIE